MFPSVQRFPDKLREDLSNSDCGHDLFLERLENLHTDMKYCIESLDMSDRHNFVDIKNV